MVVLRSMVEQKSERQDFSPKEIEQIRRSLVWHSDALKVIAYIFSTLPEEGPQREKGFQAMADLMNVVYRGGGGIFGNRFTSKDAETIDLTKERVREIKEQLKAEREERERLEVKQRLVLYSDSISAIEYTGIPGGDKFSFSQHGFFYGGAIIETESNDIYYLVSKFKGWRGTLAVNISETKRESRLVSVRLPREEELPPIEFHKLWEASDLFQTGPVKRVLRQYKSISRIDGKPIKPGEGSVDEVIDAPNPFDSYEAILEKYQPRTPEVRKKRLGIF